MAWSFIKIHTIFMKSNVYKDLHNFIINNIRIFATKDDDEKNLNDAFKVIFKSLLMQSNS